MSTLCITCRKPKANFNCGLCEESTCKSCATFLSDEFSFLQKVPADLTHKTYCSFCFDDKVAAPLAEYNEKMDKAREIVFFRKDQSKMTGHLKRKEDPFTVEDCEDEQESIMRLAFQAVEHQFNCLLDLKITTKKIIVGSHKKVIFSASAIPTNVDVSRIRED